MKVALVRVLAVALLLSGTGACASESNQLGDSQCTILQELALNLGEGADGLAGKEFIASNLKLVGSKLATRVGTTNEALQSRLGDLGQAAEGLAAKFEVSPHQRLDMTEGYQNLTTATVEVFNDYCKPS